MFKLQLQNQRSHSDSASPLMYGLNIYQGLSFNHKKSMDSQTLLNSQNLITKSTVKDDSGRYNYNFKFSKYE